MPGNSGETDIPERYGVPVARIGDVDCYMLTLGLLANLNPERYCTDEDIARIDVVSRIVPLAGEGVNLRWRSLTNERYGCGSICQRSFSRTTRIGQQNCHVPVRSFNCSAASIWGD